MSRQKHPQKDVEAALVHAEQQGWRIELEHSKKSG